MAKKGKSRKKPTQPRQEERKFSLWTMPFSEWDAAKAAELPAEIQVDPEEAHGQLGDLTEELAPFETRVGADALSRRLD